MTLQFPKISMTVFAQTFIYTDPKNINSNSKLNDIEKFEIMEKLNNMGQYYDFGFECVLNYKNDPIMILFGGLIFTQDTSTQSMLEKSMFLLNTKTKQLMCKMHVCTMFYFYAILCFDILFWQ